MTIGESEVKWEHRCGSAELNGWEGGAAGLANRARKLRSGRPTGTAWRVRVGGRSVVEYSSSNPGHCAVKAARLAKTRGRVFSNSGSLFEVWPNLKCPVQR